MVELRIDRNGETPLMETPFGKSLKKQEERIVSNEHDSLEARWLFGQHLLRARKGKQLPNGLASSISREFGIGHTEIKQRMQFAQAFRTKEEVVACATTYKTWNQIKRRALPKKPQAGKKPSKNVVKYLFEFKRWRRAAAEVAKDPQALSDKEAHELERLHQVIGSILDDRKGRAGVRRVGKRASS